MHAVGLRPEAIHEFRHVRTSVRTGCETGMGTCREATAFDDNERQPRY